MAYKARGRPRGPLRRDRLENRDIALLANYYAADSPTKGNATRSAIAAGFGESYANQKALKIIERYEDCSFRASARMMGITKPYLAMKLRAILDLPLDGNTREVISAMRLALANFGEATDQSGNGTSVNISGSSMVIVGATPKRMQALTGKMRWQRKPKPEILEVPEVANEKEDIPASQRSESISDSSVDNRINPEALLTEG